MKQKPTWIVFDVGGVLLDWRSSSTYVANDILGLTRDQLFNVLYGFDDSASIGDRMNRGEFSAHEGWNLVFSELGIPEKYDDVMTNWTASKFWANDTLRLVRELSSAGYKLAIMSNSWLGLDKTDQTPHFPAELQLFDSIFDSASIGLTKPNEDFYAYVENSLSVVGEQLFFIDDNAQNIAVARDRDWQTFLYDIGEDNTGITANIHLRQKLLSRMRF